ncbi:MAG: GatB/Yqey [Candidatus Woesebacteria bacterium GW2011_GWA1_39_21]|uniref:GatB/Yqey n=1 Tax=Candidatus Woesebacteria bacterium GW2011_GWA1_39_21 TaxID=1618550 RepID=A0A0G0N571_9BACT|nr:MAG: GatB/Yqey [Candidatus Woesebacteria bacterium GW2011_GWA1_39_21]
MIKDSLTKQIGEALKAHDELRLTTLRMLLSALNYEFIAKQHELNQDEEIAVVRREVKKRKDTVETYKSLIKNDPVHVQEKIDKEQSEIKILSEYLPAEIDEGKLNEIIDNVMTETQAKEMKDMGKVIALVKSKVGGAADGARIAEIVKSKLQ